jgi:hypothetical protein
MHAVSDLGIQPVVSVDVRQCPGLRKAVCEAGLAPQLPRLLVPRAAAIAIALQQHVKTTTMPMLRSAGGASWLMVRCLPQAVLSVTLATLAASLCTAAMALRPHLHGVGHPAPLVVLRLERRVAAQVRLACRSATP